MCRFQLNDIIYLEPKRATPETSKRRILQTIVSGILCLCGLWGPLSGSELQLQVGSVTASLAGSVVAGMAPEELLLGACVFRLCFHGNDMSAWVARMY